MVEGEVLASQVIDWRRFRSFQARLHAFWVARGRPLNDLQDRIHGLRQKHGLIHGNIPLKLDHKQQTQLQTWTEFQFFHCQRHDTLQSELATAESKLGDFDMLSEAGSPYAALLGRYKKKVSLHLDLLQWIEQMRQEFELQTKSSSIRRSRRTITRKCNQAIGQRPPNRKSKSNSRNSNLLEIDGLIKTKSGRVSKPPVRWVPC